MLKSYSAYSKIGGEEEYSILVFSHSKQEAKTVVSKSALFGEVALDFDDLTVREISIENIVLFADAEKLEAGIPHIISEPPYCEACEEWGWGVDLFDYTCLHCGEYPGDELIKLFTQDLLKEKGDLANKYEEER